jgi:spermidine/putrescine transport system permease protein
VLVFTRIKASYQADQNALSTIIVLVSVCLVVLLSKMGYSATSLFGYSSPKTKKGE